MSRWQIILRFIGRGALYGVLLGVLAGIILDGFSYLAYPSIQARSITASTWLIVIVFSGVIGLVLGAVNGLLAGAITLRFFQPLTSVRTYQVVVILFCTVISALVIGVLTINGLQFVSGWIFPGVGALAGLLGSLLLTRWYIRTYCSAKPNAEAVYSEN